MIFQNLAKIVYVIEVRIVVAFEEDNELGGAMRQCSRVLEMAHIVPRVSTVVKINVPVLSILANT